MKKIDDEILKYLSGMLSESEKIAFEERLKASDELTAQLCSVQEMLSDLSAHDADENENYFTNLVPRIRERIDSRKKNRRRTMIYYLSPSLAIIIFAILFIPNRKSISENYYGELAELVVKNSDNIEVSENYLDYVNLESDYTSLANVDEFSVGLENTVNKIPDSYLNMVDYSNSEAFRSLENLSDDELNQIYNELNEFQFQ